MEFITGSITWFLSNVEIILAVVGFLAMLATKTPNKSDDKIVQWILDIINFGAMNLGKASNKDE